MTLKGGTSQACAACKYQRRRCSAECPLSPYFPPEQPKLFQNAHKLFGVSNILKILKNLEPGQKNEAMRSIIYQANMRDKFPIYGCCWIICQLKYQIIHAEEELQAVQAQLEMYRQHHQISSMPPDDVTSQLELGMAPPSNGGLSLFNHATTPQHYNNAVSQALPVPQQQCYSNGSKAVYSSPSYMDAKDINVANSFWVQQTYGNNNNNSMAIQSQLVVSQPQAIQQEVVQEYDELHPFFDSIDDRQSYIDSKEAYESSSEESLKDTTQSTEHVAENELKNAAARFSLTSVN
ncbi:LOB domain-containing protein 27-like [Alnus glutinosa]|uniref:LOB domain-containing protein 27-like n=1 Tax=Alnus glutinosa TaxID=3517 RepID=UPI002D790F45|nr:LOB domain-containing protein 27-like [Alnus glutinosa]